MAINNEEELLAAIRSRSTMIDIARMRWRFNPHHPEEDKLFEQTMVNLNLNETDRAIVTYVIGNQIALLTSPRPEIRNLINEIKRKGKEKGVEITKANFQNILDMLESERQEYEGILKTLEDSRKNKV